MRIAVLTRCGLPNILSSVLDWRGRSPFPNVWSVGVRDVHALLCENPAAMRLFALRGATTVQDNDAEQILAATEELMRELMARNALAAEDLVSCIFTLTEDLDAEFPAVAARRMGLDRVPLMCAREVPVPGSLPRVIRVLVHCYADAALEPSHVYLGAAKSLRADLESAQ
jgi:chorismate mutase